MQCNSCGTPIPQNAAYCPVCATPTPYGISQSRVTPTFISPPSYPPPPPVEPTTDYGSHPYGESLQNPYKQLDPYSASKQPHTSPPSPVPPRRSNKIPLVAIIAAALVIVVGGAAWLISSASHTFMLPPTPTPVPYPHLSSAYSGSVHNTTYGQSAHMALTDIVQDAATINGNIRFGLPLVGSGSFTGTVSRTGTIQFVVSSLDMNGVTLTFNGSITSPNSMSGTYTVSNGQKGTWEAVSAVSPVAYPLLFPNYTGTFHNNAVNKDYSMTLEIVTQDQQNFSGTCYSTAPMNGTFEDDNSLQFTATASNGASVTFSGTVNVDGSLSGTYRASDGVTGTWKVSPTQTSVSR